MKKWNIFWSVLFLLGFMSSTTLAQTQAPKGDAPRMEREDPHKRLREGGKMERPSGHPDAGRPQMRGGSLFSAQGMAKALGLNDDQTKKMHDLMMNYRKGMIQKEAALRVAEIELEEMVADRRLPMPEIEKKAKQKEAASTDIIMFRVQSLATAKGFLSEAQFNQFMDVIERQMTGGGHRRAGSAGNPHGRMGRGMRGMKGMGSGMDRMAPHSMGHPMGRGGMSGADDDYGDSDRGGADFESGYDD